MLCFSFSSPNDGAITFCDSVCFRNNKWSDVLNPSVGAMIRMHALFGAHIHVCWVSNPSWRDNVSDCFRFYYFSDVCKVSIPSWRGNDSDVNLNCKRVWNLISLKPLIIRAIIYYYINFQIVAIIFRASLLKYIDMFLMITYCRIIPKF
jgi:hypothetical protein